MTGIISPVTAAVDILLLKLLVTPVLILAASLAGRRWGEAVSGWFVGLPLSSGPVCFFLALEHGTPFAADTAMGCLAGAAAEAGFCLAYSHVARRSTWRGAIVAGSLSYFAGAIVFAETSLPMAALAAIVVTALSSVLLLLPRPQASLLALPVPPRWDIPARMAVATTLVFFITAIAPFLGARLSGLLATYPVFAATLTVFAHRARGAAAAIGVLRGLLTGLFGFATFFVVLSQTIVPRGIAVSFVLATLACMAVQGVAFIALRR